MKLFTKLALLATFVVATAVTSFAQSPAFPFTVTPQQLTGTASKYPGGIVTLEWPVVIALPPGTTGAKIWRIYTPLSFPNSTVPAVSFTQDSGLLNPGESISIFPKVNVSTVEVGTWGVPIFIQDLQTGLAVSSILSVTITDDRAQSIPPSTTKIVPHIATGKGWTTTLLFTNPSNLPSVLEVRFFASDGLPRAFRLRDGRVTSVATVALSGYGSSSFVIEDVFNQFTVTGSAEITPILNAPVNVTTIFTTVPTPGDGTTVHEAALPAVAATVNTVTLPFDATNGLKTGVALRNSLNYPQIVTLQFYDEGGTLLTTQTLNMSAKSQFSFLAELREVVGTKGSVRITMPFAALNAFALRFDKNLQFIPIF